MYVIPALYWEQLLPLESYDKKYYWFSNCDFFKLQYTLKLVAGPLLDVINLFETKSISGIIYSMCT